MHVIATAGHVDHGKTTLVRALTGMEPDRWAQERQRGMTIDLGFAWTTLGGTHIAFVDVPGHERFLSNMLAGVGPVPTILLVIAADEGWMPQTAEHVAAAHALGVQDGLIAVTRSDLCDPAEAMKETRAHLAGTCLRTAEAVPVSGRIGRGLPELRTALARLVSALPPPDTLAPVRLWIDRAFTVRGSGVVVTGTLPAGTIRRGDELVLAPSGRPVRVRALEMLGDQAASATAVARVGVNLRGVELREIARGMALLSPGAWIVTDAIDVGILAGAAPDADRLPGQLALHIGSARTVASVRQLGGTPIARLKLRHSLPLHVGDRVLLRDEGRPREQRAIIGARVLDVLPPSLRRRGAAAQRGQRLLSIGGIPDGAFHLEQRGVVRAAELIAMGCDPPPSPRYGPWLVHPSHWVDLGQRLVQLTEHYARQNPLEPGLPTDTARQLLGLPDRRLVEKLVSPPLHLARGRVRHAAQAQELPASVAAAVRRICAELQARPYRAPEQEKLISYGLDRKALAAAVHAGQLMQVARGIVLLPGADAEAARVLARLHQPFTVSDARNALDTSRRVVIPLLEHLDRAGYTERVDSVHRRSRAGAPRTDD